SALIVVTAGVHHAVDAAGGRSDKAGPEPGAINIWVFVNGNLRDEAFIQCIMTAAEAKGKAQQEMGVKGQATHTPEAATSADGILIAATQCGEECSFGRTDAPLGQLIRKGVFQCTKQALQHNRS